MFSLGIQSYYNYKESHYVVKNALGKADYKCNKNTMENQPCISFVNSYTPAILNFFNITSK